MAQMEEKRAINTPVSGPFYEAVKAAAARRSTTVAQYVREALEERLARDEQYFYVKLPDGSYWPPSDEPGFEMLSVATLSAEKRGGRVVTRPFRPKDKADAARH